MGLLDIFRKEPVANKRSRPQASGQVFESMDDPALLEYIRSGGAGSETSSGAYVTANSALTNMAVLRCVTLISNAVGMLPLHLFEAGDDRRKATEHPLHKVLHKTPNNWQTPMRFKRLMQMRALSKGAGYAAVTRSRGMVTGLIPLDTHKVKPRQRNDWSVEYVYTPEHGKKTIIQPEDMLCIPDLDEDGVTGMSRVNLAKEAIGLALQAEQAAAKLFKNGMMVGGSLETDVKLSDNAYNRLRDSMQDQHTGSENAQRWMILEEGLKASKLAQTGRDSQHLENRNHQIEEVARAFGVPRPLLMMDDTSWGSGIEQLGIFFVQYALAPWFTTWEEEISRVLLTERERDRYYAKFNERALLRGTLSDQSEFFAKALGSGGHEPWMTPNEVRDLSELPRRDDGDALKPQRNEPNEPTQPAGS